MNLRSKALTAVAVALGFATVSADVPQGIETFEAAWKIVHDTHFDKTFNGVDWDAAREEFRPRLPRPRSPPVSSRRVISDDARRLGQSHLR